MSDIIVCKEVRQVKGGFIVEMRWPFGDEPSGYGEVVCKTIDEVVELIREAVIEDDHPHGQREGE